MKQLWKIIAYVALGISSFLFFLYLSFPYEVLKERLVLEVSDLSGMTIQIGELEPSFPVGIQLEKINILSSKAKVSLKHASVNVSLLSILLGKVKLKMNLEDNQGGDFEAQIAFSILELLKQNYPLMPTDLFVEANRFTFGQIVDFLLKKQAESPSVNLLIKPLIESVGVDGKLDTLIDMSLDGTDMKLSEGSALIKLHGAVLRSNNANITIPDQIFSKFLLSAKLKNGEFKFEKDTGLVSQDLDVKIDGKVIQKPQLMRSFLDFLVDIKLGKPLMKEVGFILDTLTQRETQGKIKIKIKGSLSPQPQVSIE